MIRSLLIITSVWLLTSCTIEETTTFNSDFSGRTTIKMDLSMMVQMMASMDSSGMAKKGFYSGINEKMGDGVDSMRNVNPSLKLDMNFDTVSNKVSISYSFSSLEEANNIGAQFSEGKQKPENSDYKWIKKMEALQMPEVDTGDGQSGKMQGMDQMIYSMSRTFPNKVVRVSDDRLKISADGKTVTMNLSFKELTDNPMKNPTVYFK